LLLWARELGGEAELAGAVEGDGAGWWQGGGACRLGWPAAGSTGVRCASGGTAAVTFLFLHFVFIMWGIEEDFVRIK
jgi:hypothetical protein